MKEMILSMVVVLFVFIMPVVWAGQGVQGLIERAFEGDPRSQ